MSKDLSLFLPVLERYALATVAPISCFRWFQKQKTCRDRMLPYMFLLLSLVIFYRQHPLVLLAKAGAHYLVLKASEKMKSTALIESLNTTIFC